MRTTTVPEYAERYVLLIRPHVLLRLVPLFTYAIVAARIIVSVMDVTYTLLPYAENLGDLLKQHVIPVPDVVLVEVVRVVRMNLVHVVRQYNLHFVIYA